MTSEVEHSKDQQPCADTNRQETKGNLEQAPPENPIPEKPPITQPITQRPKWHYWENIQRVISVLTLAVLTIYTVITGVLLWNARDTTQRQLRAYVAVEGVPISKIDSSTPTTIRVTISNIGQTPAYNVYIFSDIRIADYPLEGITFAPCVAVPKIGSRIYIGKGVTHTMTKKHVFSAADIGDIQSGANRRLYAIGRVCYTDIFKRVIHHTDFCVMYFGQYITAEPTPYCEKYNDAN